MTEVFNAAVAYLARREHGAEELADKLLKKGYASADVHSAIVKCQSLDLQSDQRFVAMLVRVRVQQGYGPERIRRDIQQKKVDRIYYEQALLEEPVDWKGRAQQVLRKKYKSCQETSWPMQQKQKQFLLYRGFSMQTIAQVFEQEITE